MRDLHDLAPAYVLDALEPDERESFLQHLDTCEECQAEVDVLSGGVDHLFDEVATRAPAALKARVLSATQPPGSVVSLRRRGARNWIVATGVAAAIALTLGVTTIIFQDRSAEARAIADVLSSADASIVLMEGAPGHLVHSGDSAVFISHELPELPSDSTYQLWLIDEDGHEPAGVFMPDATGASVVLLAEDVTEGKIVGITVEPAGGSTEPTGEVLATAEL